MSSATTTAITPAVCSLSAEKPAQQNPRALSRAFVGPGIFLSRPRGDGSESNETVGFKDPYEASGGTFVEVARPTEVFPGAWLTGPVPRSYPERNWSGNKRVKTAAGLVEDTLPEDISLILDTEQGLVVVTGCGHAGVINTLEYARKTVRNAPVHALLGGIHLFPADEAALDWTAGKLREMGLKNLLGADSHGDRVGLWPPAAARPGPWPLRRWPVGAGFDLTKGILPGTIAR